MKKGSNVQRSLFSPRLRAEYPKRSGSLLVSALCWLAVACSATIKDPGVDGDNGNAPNGGDEGGSSNGMPGGGRSSSAGSNGGSSSTKPQGGGSQNVGGNGSGNNSGSGSNTGSGNNTGNGGSGNSSGSGNGSNAGSGNNTGNGGSGNTGSGAGGVLGTAIPSELPTPSACNDATKPSPGPRVLRRLSAAEFKNSVGDLFGDRSVALSEVFNDQKVLGFSVDNNALVVQGLNADQLMANAEAVADWAVKNKLNQITTCQTLDDNCGKTFIKAFLKKAFRRAIQDSEVTPYLSLFKAEASFNEGATSVVTAVLQSPNFLYRSELGTSTSGTTTLTPYEVANELSYLLTGTSPDTQLMQAADSVASGSKQLSQMVNDEANRLITSNVAQDAVMSFMTGWVGLDRLASAVKVAPYVDSLNDSIRADMAAETRAFILDLFSNSGKVADLFSGNTTFLNDELAKYYGVTPPGSTSMKKVTLEAGKRDGGLLAQGSILTGYARADFSSPTQRGHLVRSRLLCQEVPPPPAGLDTKFQPTAAAKTTRDHYLQEHATPQRAECYGCHKLMDPVGFAFEHYDPIGRWRTQENGVDIDATGTINSASPTDGDVAIDGLTGPKGLQGYLATSKDLKTCLVRYWTYYAFGASSWSQDACTYDSVNAEANKSEYALKSVLLAIVKSPRFTQRDQ